MAKYGSHVSPVSCGPIGDNVVFAKGNYVEGKNSADFGAARC